MKSARFGAAFAPPLVLVGLSMAPACSSPASEITSTSPYKAVGNTPQPGVQAPVRNGRAHIMQSRRNAMGNGAHQDKPGGTHTKPSVFGPSNRLEYFGGPIIANVVVVGVDWTGAVDSNVQAVMPGFYTSVTGPGSPYFSWLAEYGTTCAFGPPYAGGAPGPSACTSSVGLTGAADNIAGSNQALGFGTFDTNGNGPGGMYVITPTNTSMTLNDMNGDITTELSGQITAGHLPPPTVDGTTQNVNSVYMIDFPLGYTIIAQGPAGPGESCAAFCGFHNTMIYDGLAVAYGVLPDMSPSSSCYGDPPKDGFCGPYTDYVNNSTAVHSHELVESITDTAVGLGDGIGRPLGWYDPGSMTDSGGEAADLCDAVDTQITFDAGADGGVTYAVQEIWSNQNNACIAVAPFCTPMTPTPPSCTPCTSSSQCGMTPETPDCETNSSSSFFGECVACTSDAPCGVLTCNTSTDTCQCTSSSQCANPTPACGTASTCVACTSDEQCKGNAAGEACASSGSCVPCTKDSDCPADTPLCNTFSNTCYASNDAGSDASMPPVDAGHVDSGSKPDSGPRDAGNTGGGPVTSGCSAAPSPAPRPETPALLVMAGLVGLVVFARRHAKPITR
jgi:MYXO-CTERM domain-containing protein